MPVPTTIADLSTVAASNGPSSTDTINTGDDYLRAHASIIKRLATGADPLTTPQINDTSADHQYVFAVSELTADRTVTLPLLTGNDEFVFKDHAQTLTQKTLTSPTISGGTLNNAVIGGVTPAAATVTDLAVNGNTTLGDASGDAVNVKAAAWTLTNSPTVTGTWANLGSVTTADINGGTVDGAVIGGASAAAGTFTTLTSTGNAALGDAEASDTHAIKGATTLLANSASAALTVTQTGLGNSFVVEDSASTDSTPFVIDATGAVISGHTALIASVKWDGTSITPELQKQGSAQGSASLGLFGWSASTSSTGNLIFNKSKSGAIGTRGIVASGDVLGSIGFAGDDGAAFISSANIRGEVDGTPGTNDMPGRLVFSTTADGASSPTERMRIDSAGNVGVGTGTIESAIHVRATSAGAWTGMVLQNRSSTIATEAGVRFIASATDIADNRYSEISSVNTDGATGRALVFKTGGAGAAATERMRIDSAGNVGIGGAATAGRSLEVLKNITGSTSGFGVRVNATTQSDVTSGVYYVATNAATASSNFAIGSIVHYYANATATFANVTAGGSVTNQYGFWADSTLTGATNNYGFYSNIASGTGRWNFYAAGTAANAFSGDVTIFGAGGLGYSTGSGGAVTQTTNRTTGVTLNKTNGAITLVSAAGTTSWQSFTVTNSAVAATDVVKVCQKSGTDLYLIHVTAVAAGSFRITYATTGGTTTEQPVFNFAVIKAVAA